MQQPGYDMGPDAPSHAVAPGSLAAFNAAKQVQQQIRRDSMERRN